MEPNEAKMDLHGREFKITKSPITTYATGGAVVSLGDTVIMANATLSEEGREGTDFFPLSVNYEENMYATGKIKGSRFLKRKGRPSENAILISRLIDRPIRPLFPKGTTNEVQLICTALSADLEVDPGTTALNAASVALLLSGAPFEGPVGAVRMGYKDDKLIVNPTYQECEEGKLNLVVAGTMDAITMVEAAANEVSEDVILEAFQVAHEEIKKICQFQLDYVKQFEIEPFELTVVKPDEELVEKVKSFTTDEMLDTVKGKTKKEINKKKKEISEEILENFEKEIEEETYSEGEIKGIIGDLLEKRMREMILGSETRIDGRKLDEIRPIHVYRDILPRTHGSAIFQRGETMALTVTTLGSPGDSQLLDSMDQDITKRYIHHYHFPPYATGDIKRIGSPNRREIGHGDLAERALLPMIPPKEKFPYTIWVVSEIIKCNGSSSMASVCGSTLSLMCAGVPIIRPVSGIAMGLISNSENGDYKILSDIQGMEDFAGDMDFKVTGTTEGITALQMDIKVKGLSMEIMKEALEQAKNGRQEILDKMLDVVPETSKEMSKFAPLIITLNIDPDMIRVVIGKGGETIQAITAECDVDIDIDDDGLITITAPDQEKGNKAVEWIKKITYVPEVGDTFDGTVTRLMEFGAFVEFIPGKEGLVHISELANERVNKVEDVVKVGDKFKVKLIKIDDQGRYNLSRKAALGSGGGDHDKPKSDHKKSEDKKEDDGPKVSRQGAEGETVKGTSNVREV